MKQQLEHLIFFADLWDTYAQQERRITILEVYAVVEEHIDHHWHLLYRFWGKTIANETVDEQALRIWLKKVKAEQFLQSGQHPLSGVYSIPRTKP